MVELCPLTDFQHTGSSGLPLLHSRDLCAHAKLTILLSFFPPWVKVCGWLITNRRLGRSRLVWWNMMEPPEGPDSYRVSV